MYVCNIIISNVIYLREKRVNNQSRGRGMAQSTAASVPSTGQKVGTGGESKSVETKAKPSGKLDRLWEFQ